MSVREVLNNGELFGIARGKINTNFLVYNTDKIESTDVLIRTNATPYTPTNPYNPATKQYVDNSDTAIRSTYDPQSINGDSFNLNLHTGEIDASQVTQDVNNRFASDVEKTIWSGKENSIGVKGTAFNKNFGTIVGSVSEGNHSHTGTYEAFNTNIQTHIARTDNPHATTKTHLGLENVDNTSDLDKPISTAGQAALDDKRGIGDLIEFVDFAPQSTPPTHSEGRVFYDDDSKSMSFYTDIEDVTINLNREQIVRVFNATGSTILNGKACRQEGVDATTGLPKIVLAIADSFVNASVLGFATHDIPNNSQGEITAHGDVNDVPTTHLTQGTVFLSDTVAGEVTNTAPDIVTIMGEAQIIGVAGKLFSSPRSIVAIPNILGELDSIAATYNLTTSYQDLNGYTNEDSVVLPTDKTNGYIAPPNIGKYRATFNVTASLTSSPSTRTVTVQLWNNDTSTEVYLSTISIPKDATQFSRSFSKLFDVPVVDEDYIMRILSSIAISGVTFDNISFDVQSVHIR